LTQSLDRILFTRTFKNVSICEAYGCNNQATKQIVVSAGSLGNADLNLCKNCVAKFSDSNDNDTMTKNGSLVHSLLVDDKKSASNNEYTTAYL